MTATIAVERNRVYPLTTQLYIHECGGCGIVWGVPNEWDTCRREDGKTFYCPNGCPRAYNESEADRLKKRVELLENRVRWRDDQLDAAQRDAKLSRYRMAAAKGQLTKIKNRIARGVCPVPGCKRSGLGADVVAHIATCHPDFHGHEATS